MSEKPTKRRSTNTVAEGGKRLKPDQNDEEVEMNIKKEHDDGIMDDDVMMNDQQLMEELTAATGGENKYVIKILIPQN